MYNLIEKIFFAVKEIIGQLGYFGIAGAMMIESMCIPLPSEMTLPMAGFMVADGKMNLLTANVAVAIGSMVGSLIAYTVGYYGGRPFILNYGKYFFVSKEHYFKAENTFNKYGNAAVFFGRLLPVIRTFISLPAGMAKMDLKKFVLFSLAGMLPWNFILIFLGLKLGQNYETIVHPIFKRFEYVVLGALILAILLLIIRGILKKRKKAVQP